MVINNYFLIFNSHFNRDKGIDEGRLSICSLENGTLEVWIARSSHATKQYRESFHSRGGYLPPEYRVPELPNWTVSTVPIDLTQHRGVAGNFYQITPFEVTTDKGGKRSDFGIHLDANAPGSMGCIVRRHNYTWASKQLGIDLVNNPQLATQLEISCRIAALYWSSRNLNKYADWNSERGFKIITRKINGGYNGWMDRLNHWRITKKVLHC